MISILTAFSALRLESGQDWEAYADFFYQIDTSTGIFNYLRFGSYSASQFEFGFFLINYFVKILNGDYYHVLSICSVISGVSIYIFYRQIKEHTDFAIISYVGYAFLILGFSQARQSVGLACFLFALTFYLRSDKSILYFFAFSCIGITFQYSVVIYIFIALIAYLLTRFVRLARFAVVALLFLAIIVKNLNTNLFQYFMLLAFNDTIVDKVNIYEADLSQGGILNFLYSLILLANAIYVYSNSISQTNFKHKFICNLAASSLYLSFLIVFVLPGFYPLYSRVYTLGSILLPVAFYYVGTRKNTISLNMFITVNYVALTISYFKIFYLFSDDYLPYSMWIQ